jgi:hypothetical protein
MSILYANFYPESLTLFVELGRSPDLRLATNLPVDVQFTGTQTVVLKWLQAFLI